MKVVRILHYHLVSRIPFEQRVWLQGTLLPCILIALGLLPIWAVQYVPLYDYQTHLLEAQVVVQYSDPALAYAPNYQTREGWYLRSNALTTLLMIALGSGMAIELAGKIVLSLYIILLVGGLTALFSYLGQSSWLLLTLPVLLYNLTFTAGMLNWSYGFALIPFVVLCYLHWQQHGTRWAIAVLALLVLLIYLAHVLAWGLCLIAICTIAVTDHLRPRPYLLLCLALSSPVVLLAITRPSLALAPAIIAMVAWWSAAVIRRLKLTPAATLLVASGAALLYLGGIKATKEIRTVLSPDVGYSLNSKLVTLPRLFTLPHHLIPIQWDLVGYNLILLALLSAIIGILVVSSITYYRTHRIDSWRWLTTLGVLMLCYFIIPSRTADIVVTEPRVLLLACVIGLLAAHLPLATSRLYGILISLFVALAILVPSVTFIYAWRYNAAAYGWSRALAQIPPASRVLVLAHPYPIPTGGQYDLLRAAQIFDPGQFASTYALEHGGFISNTFFNGPLLPLRPTAIPLYWWIEFDNTTFVMERCDLIHTAYDYVVVWNMDEPLFQALRNCYGEPMSQEEQIAIWARP